MGFFGPDVPSEGDKDRQKWLDSEPRQSDTGDGCGEMVIVPVLLLLALLGSLLLGW